MQSAQTDDGNQHLLPKHNIHSHCAHQQTVAKRESFLLSPDKSDFKTLPDETLRPCLVLSAPSSNLYRWCSSSSSYFTQHLLPLDLIWPTSSLPLRNSVFARSSLTFCPALTSGNGMILQPVTVHCTCGPRLTINESAKEMSQVAR